nr:hypothetical protein [Candidatus Cardinium hertigii]
MSKKIAIERSNVGLKKAATIGVMYSYEAPAKHEIVQRFIRELKNLDKKVIVVCYTTEKDRVYPSSSLLYAFGHEAITAFGKIKNDRIQKFIDVSFDYLFHVDMETNPVLDYIIAHNRAKCRVGHFDPMRRSLFEVMVKVRRTIPIEDMKRLTHQMLHYTGCMES